MIKVIGWILSSLLRLNKKLEMRTKNTIYYIHIIELAHQCNYQILKIVKYIALLIN